MASYYPKFSKQLVDTNLSQVSATVFWFSTAAEGRDDIAHAEPCVVMSYACVKP
jgi:hypothetical protein